MSAARLAFTLEAGVARIVLANPDNRNAVDHVLTRELREAAVACEVAPALRCVVIAAEGPYFSVGGDLREFQRERSRIRAHVRQMTIDFHAAIATLNRLPVPVIAAVNGFAAGGGASLVCMSDLAIASRAARFNFAYTRSGLTPDGGATWFLPRLVGAQRAFALLALNPTLSAEEAHAIGLVARVVEEADFGRELESIIARILESPPETLGITKALLRQGLRNTLAEQLELEGGAIAAQAASPGTLARLDAFLERPPSR